MVASHWVGDTKSAIVFSILFPLYFLLIPTFNMENPNYELNTQFWASEKCVRLTFTDKITQIMVEGQPSQNIFLVICSENLFLIPMFLNKIGVSLLATIVLVKYRSQGDEVQLRQKPLFEQMVNNLLNISCVMHVEKVSSSPCEWTWEHT